MSDSPTAQEGLPAQEPISAPSAVTPAPVPPEGEGHAAPAGTPPKAPEPVSEPATFFDRNAWNEHLNGLEPQTAEHLRALERQLTGQWTRKNQEVSKYRTDSAEKVQAYDAFMEQVNRDPAGALKALAEQLGIKPAASSPAESKNYETWDQVYSDFRGRVLEEVKKELGPVLTNVHKLTSQNVEQQLDSIDPDWRVYEDRITANIRAYPQMVKDLHTLYRISVPEDVMMQRAQREALKKIEKQTKAAAPAGPSKVKKGPGTTTAPSNFEEAVQEAKKSLGYI